MPPFEAEPAERRHNSIPFLKQCLNDPTPSSGSGGSLSKPFGAELAEPATGDKPKRASVKRVLIPFQSEREEGDHKPVGPSKKAKPFEDEHDEGDELVSSSSGCEDDYKPKSNTAFALGWQAADRLQAATFWTQNSDEVKTGPKRIYDNSKRKETAVYARNETQGAFKQNGLDPNRLRDLFASPSCKCH